MTHDFPCFFLPQMVAAAEAALDVHLEQVDSNGLLPLRATGQVFRTAYAFRRYLQAHLPELLDTFPGSNPLSGLKIPSASSLPDSINHRWPAASTELLSGDPARLAELPFDHTVDGVPDRGGALAGRLRLRLRRLRRFLKAQLPHYWSAATSWIPTSAAAFPTPSVQVSGCLPQT